MTRGRKPKPADIKELDGNPGRRPFSQIEPGLLPKMPRDLSKGARPIWRSLLPMLAARVALQPFHAELLGQLCVAIHRRRQCDEIIDATGVVIKGARGAVKNPAAQLSRQYGLECQRLGSLFGMSPSDLQRVPGSMQRRIDPIAAARAALRGESAAPAERVQ